MENYCLSVDSTSPVTDEEKKKFEIVSTGLTYTIDGRESLDTFKTESEKEAFYTQLRNGAKAQSSKASPLAFINSWRPILEKGKKILHLSLSSKVSGSYDSACLAGQELMETYPDAVKVIDTKTGSYCNTKMAIEAYALQKNNWSIDKIVEWVRKEAQRFNLIFTVDDIGHLHRGGRIGHVKAIIGSVLNLKPILYVSGAGKLESVSNARGVKKAISDIVERIKRNADENTTWAYIAHGGDESLAQQVKEKIMSTMSFIKNVDIGVLSPVLGLHAGPGALAVSFMGKERDLILGS